MLSKVSVVIFFYGSNWTFLNIYMCSTVILKREYIFYSVPKKAYARTDILNVKSKCLFSSFC